VRWGLFKIATRPTLMVRAYGVSVRDRMSLIVVQSYTPLAVDDTPSVRTRRFPGGGVLTVENAKLDATTPSFAYAYGPTGMILYVNVVLIHSI
jgi:hypothetical protein